MVYLPSLLVNIEAGCVRVVEGGGEGYKFREKIFLLQ